MAYARELSMGQPATAPQKLLPVSNSAFTVHYARARERRADGAREGQPEVPGDDLINGAYPRHAGSG